MLTRLVNGNRVVIDPVEQDQIRARGAANLTQRQREVQDDIDKRDRVIARAQTVAAQLGISADDLKELIKELH